MDCQPQAGRDVAFVLGALPCLFVTVFAGWSALEALAQRMETPPALLRAEARGPKEPRLVALYVPEPNGRRATLLIHLDIDRQAGRFAHTHLISNSSDDPARLTNPAKLQPTPLHRRITVAGTMALLFAAVYLLLAAIPPRIAP